MLRTLLPQKFMVGKLSIQDINDNIDFLKMLAMKSVTRQIGVSYLESNTLTIIFEAMLCHMLRNRPWCFAHQSIKK